MNKKSSECPDDVILGDCCISLSHSTTYEPPLYLFPELLPKVPLSTKRAAVWDGVADAIDVKNSFWRLSNVRFLDDASKFAGLQDTSDVGNNPTTLASMVASNRLSTAGITCEILAKDQFSSQAITKELSNYCNTVGFSDKEKTQVMSNHFLNILAWLKLCEVNFSHSRANKAKSSNGSGICRKRSRNSTEEEDVSENLPLPFPWLTEMDELFAPGRFISGMEKDVEKKIEELQILSQLYEKPLLSLCSRGQQTDYIVPQGTINTTSPYRVLPSSSGKAHFNGVSDLQLSTLAFSSPPHIVARILSNFGDTDSETLTKEVVPLTEFCTNLGRNNGVISIGTRGRSTRINIGLGKMTSFPHLVSPLHFSILQMSQDTVVLLNYGKNGIKVEGQKWVLGEPLTVQLPVMISATRDLKVELLPFGSINKVEETFNVKRESD